ncbi:flagellar basal body P-ring formation chaperone FlgA [Halomonas beimenensis]|uniref:Flagella basal body P-ring formation protein FlgA n=2 Tax=Halomonas beimenensis TaxID=475662 RepID=A0A291PCW3_9GAMM|nr:flagellar basal body P-ring formation chaperone FlgA [Halomonas beimenensis]ATJ84689.1 flagella basal body P-ring formation protein FlgA [Halomonas beimenensis]
MLLCAQALPVFGQEEWLERARAFLTQQASGLGDDVEVTLYPPGAHFPECRQPEPFLPASSRPPLGRLSVGVKCGETDRRTRYLQAEVVVIGRYLETATALEAGERLTLAHLAERRGELHRLPHGTLRAPQAAIGQVTRRPLAAGRPLLSHQLRAPRLVDRGDRVTLEARGDGFRVTRKGEALAPGGRGERIRVRLEDRRILEARIVGPGRLVVDN